MDVQNLLFTALQLLLTGGVGGVLILGYATKDIFVKKEEERLKEEPRFLSEYQELMWLADKQRKHLNAEEAHRFYQLRNNWSEMHSSIA